MNCEQNGELLSALADEELPAPAAWRLRRHVRGCARCQAELAALREARAAPRRLRGDGSAARGDGGLSEAVPSVPRPVHHSPGAPPDFWASVSRRLDAVDAAARGRASHARRPRWGFAAALLAAAAALVVAALVLPRPSAVSPTWVAARHRQPLRSDQEREALLSVSPSEASAWLSRRLGRPVPPVDLELAGLELRGALAWSERGRPAGLLRYGRGAEGWSLLVVPGAGKLAGARETMAGRQPLQRAAGGGAQLAAWRSKGSLFVFAGPRENELLRGASQAARACEIER
jgi:anti-sigma factor RsiW